MRRIGPGVEAFKFQEVIRRSLLPAKLRESGGIAAKTLARATIIPPASTGHYIHRTLFVIPQSAPYHCGQKAEFSLSYASSCIKKGASLSKKSSNNE